MSLTYRAPEGCPDDSAFVHGVDGRTDEATWVASGEGATALEVIIEESGDRIVGRLVVKEPARPPAAPRQVEDATCATVVDALALVAALAIDPEASLSVRAPATPPLQVSPPASAVALADEPTPAAVEIGPLEPTWRFSLGAQVGITSGFGPPGAVQLIPLYADLRRSAASWRPSVRLAFSAMLPSERSAPYGSARLVRLSGQLSGCPIALDVEFFRLAPCLGGEAGMFRAEGFDVAGARSVSHPWAAAFLALRTSARFDRFLFGAEAQGGVPITRPRVIIGPDHVLAETAPVNGSLAADLAVELP